jgi:hypothetical protein
VRTGRRQSMPSSSIDNCARVSTTVPLFGLRPDEAPALQTLRKQAQPVAIPPQQLDQIAAPTAEDTKTCPEKGSCSSAVCTSALRPVKPRRRSVVPAASQMCAPVGGVIIPKRLQHRTQGRRVGTALDAQPRLAELDMNCAWYRVVPYPIQRHRRPNLCRRLHRRR